MDADQQLFDVAIVAQKMGITPEAVRKRIARGSLQAVKQDGRWYVAASGVSWENGDDRPVHAAPDDKGIVTVAKKMGITPEALRKAIARGSLQVMKRGGSGFSVVQLAVALQRKLSFPFVTVVMTLIAVPFAVMTGRRGAMYAIGVGLALAITYWITISVFGAVGSAGLLAPTLAAWAPNILFSAGASYLLLTVRT